MMRVAVKPELLRWARGRAGRSAASLRGKFPNIEAWERDEARPTLKQLEKFAQATHTPFGFFFLEKPPREELPIRHFRTVDGGAPRIPSPDLLDTVYLMQRRQWWMQDYLIEQGDERLPFVASASIDDGPDAAAEKMRQVLGFQLDWTATYPSWEATLRALREGMEKAGILVVANGIVGNNPHRKLNVAEFRGFVLVDEYAPLVFVNNTDYRAAQMFTLAHELAHILYGSSAAFDLREMQPANDLTERASDRAAAEFLVPQIALRQIWTKVKTDSEPFQTIARRFKVSAIVAARRALDLGLISKTTFFEFYRRRRRSRPPGGGDFYANQNLRVGRRFASALIREVKSGKMSYGEAYRLTGLYGNTFEKYASHLGLGGGEG